MTPLMHPQPEQPNEHPVDRYIFVFSLPRSGSKWMSKVLGEDERVDARHEPHPNPMETRLSEDVIQNGSYHSAFWYDEKVNRVEGSIEEDKSIWGEASHKLLPHADYVQQIDHVDSIHVVRRPEDFVRSVCERWLRDDMTLEWYETLFGEDERIGKVERASKYWARINGFLNDVGNLVRLEELSRSWKYFEANIVEPIGLDIDKEEWENWSKNPVHSIDHKMIRPYGEWPDQERETLSQIVEPLRNNLGYGD